VSETPTITALLIDRSLGNRGCVAHKFFVMCTEPQQLPWLSCVLCTLISLSKIWVIFIFFLDIKVSKLGDGILLSQGKYTSDILQCIGMQACKASPTPLSTSEKLSKEGELLG
jgi:hypothetical protein